MRVTSNDLETLFRRIWLFTTTNTTGYRELANHNEELGFIHSERKNLRSGCDDDG